MQLKKRQQIAIWVSVGSGVAFFLAFAIPAAEYRWISYAFIAVGVAASIYRDILKRQIQNKEYQILEGSLRDAQIASLAAASKLDSAKSRAAKARAADTISSSAGALHQLPEASSPDIRALTTLQDVERELAITTLKKKNMTLWASICLSVGILGGVSAFVLPLAACSAQTNGYDSFGRAITAFFTTLFVCLGIGIGFGVAAAALRSFARDASNRIHELNMQSIRVKARSTRQD